jgi:hypothetical protein
VAWQFWDFLAYYAFKRKGCPPSRSHVRVCPKKIVTLENFVKKLCSFKENNQKGERREVAFVEAEAPGIKSFLLLFFKKEGLLVLLTFQALKHQSLFCYILYRERAEDTSCR